MINISEQAGNYIRQKGGCVHVFLYEPVGICCGNIDLGPTVRLGRPLDPENYCLQPNNHDLKLYVPRGFSSRTSLAIKIKTVLGIRSLYIDGWKVFGL